mmetsp:Transcript_12708/g.29213  ORF Transcript_12708/g.29213 Transcript_12708/m.29213 type:complete len:215 (-) Transcript_12708:23-667(-)
MWLRLVQDVCLAETPHRTGAHRATWNLSSKPAVTYAKISQRPSIAESATRAQPRRGRTEDRVGNVREATRRSRARGGRVATESLRISCRCSVCGRCLTGHRHGELRGGCVASHCSRVHSRWVSCHRHGPWDGTTRNSACVVSSRGTGIIHSGGGRGCGGCIPSHHHVICGRRVSSHPDGIYRGSLPTEPWVTSHGRGIAPTRWSCMPRSHAISC